MIPHITFHPKPAPLDAIFSIVIPSWNNLSFLQCCVESIRKNSRFPHEIIVHINEGSDGSLEWVKSQILSYSYSTKNAGVCYGFNAPATLATTQYIVLSDDDFYFAPDWDVPLVEEIKKLGHLYFCITGTMIEHTVTFNRCALAPFDFGRTVADFDEARFLKEYASLPFKDWTGGNWYPMVIHKTIWQLIGGLSTEFSPGMGSDPDMMMKLWHCGVRYYKGLSSSRVYHFGSRTTSRIKKNNGYNQFLLKWGLSNSTFSKLFLRQGESFTGASTESVIPTRLKIKDALKRFFAVLKNNRA